MRFKSLLFCSSFAYPPNSLYLCGPDKAKDLSSYINNQYSDKGTIEILSKFNTMFPYLKFIAGENKINDIFDPRVVEGYWIGNDLINNIKPFEYGNFIFEELKYKKLIGNKNKSFLVETFRYGVYPTHAYHVLNIWSRTGYISDIHSIDSVNACLIRSGQIIGIEKNKISLKMNFISNKNNLLSFTEEKIIKIDISKSEIKKIKLNEYIMTHWGKFVMKSDYKKHIMLNRNIRQIVSIINKIISQNESRHYLYSR